MRFIRQGTPLQPLDQGLSRFNGWFEEFAVKKRCPVLTGSSYMILIDIEEQCELILNV